ncbi:WS/DGAT/MGAT family O-acyltransferase [Nocardia veterana]|uniref:Diacylglycerol O-acyltransferase n=1 Tax=Nocardia veterana TaxID=132249 RepID=A0A7X6LVW0_9NOCA|nr:wax ester/triacylglycerol synthase family O-acyltransferase [Nocardia veterana]NKY84910.1 wax ester/triacylglycerol synthase family O-acyltransferase [Nocardia veterana]
MALMSPLDSVFLLLESREHPMHVGGLSLFRPSGAQPHSPRRLHEELISGEGELAPVFRRRPARSLASFSALQWELDDDIDIEYHVRLLSLPAPGRVRELLELVSMLHGSLLDRHRPLWEVYVIDGLADGRIALYTKTHHALMDGVSAVRTWQRALSADPDDRGCLPPWRSTRPRGHAGGTTLLRRSADVLRTAGRIGAAVPEMVSGAYELARDYPEPRPFRAPRTMFNVAITGARRFAAQSWPLPRLRAAGAGTGATLNDIVLAMCAGALRRYLLAEQALPADPLIAMVPVSLRRGPETAVSEGNSVGAALCDLATDAADPVERLTRIHASMANAKNTMSRLTPLQILGMSAINVAGLALPASPVRLPASAPPFNIIISNVPGAAEPRYWNGLRLEAVYPASIPLDGQAINITTVSSGDAMHFGIVGCRRSVPHLQRLLTGLEQSLVELESCAR